MLPDLDPMPDNNPFKNGFNFSLIPKLNLDFISRFEFIVIAERKISFRSGPVRKYQPWKGDPIEGFLHGDLCHAKLVAEDSSADENFAADYVCCSFSTGWDAI